MQHLTLRCAVLLVGWLHVGAVFGQKNTRIELFFAKNTPPIQFVHLFDHGQSVVSERVAYADTLGYAFVAQTDDRYHIWCLAEGQKYVTDLWLGVGRSQVWLSCTQNGQLRIDSVAGSSVFEAVRTRVGCAAADATCHWAAYTREQGTAAALEHLLHIVETHANNRPELLRVHSTLQYQSPAIRAHWLFRKVEEATQSALLADPIDLHNFDFYDTKNQLAQLSPPGGDSLVLLDFWFLGCKPCMEQHQTLRTEWGSTEWPARVRLVGISIDREAEDWSAYLEQHRLDWPNYRTGPRDLARHLGLRGFPTYVLLDPSGRVLRKCHSYAEMRSFLHQK
jgi:thiol-disulfide isomerase/thioredoxin